MATRQERCDPTFAEDNKANSKQKNGVLTCLSRQRHAPHGPPGSSELCRTPSPCWRSLPELGTKNSCLHNTLHTPVGQMRQHTHIKSIPTGWRTLPMQEQCVCSPSHLPLFQLRRLQFAQVTCDVMVEEVHLGCQNTVLSARLSIVIRTARSPTPDAGWTLSLQES